MKLVRVGQVWVAIDHIVSIRPPSDDPHDMGEVIVVTGKSIKFHAKDDVEKLLKVLAVVIPLES